MNFDYKTVSQFWLYVVILWKKFETSGMADTRAFKSTNTEGIVKIFVRKKQEIIFKKK